MRLNNDLPARWAVWALKPDGRLCWLSKGGWTDDYNKAEHFNPNEAHALILQEQVGAVLDGEMNAPPWSIGIFPLRELEKLTPSREGEGLRS